VTKRRSLTPPQSPATTTDATGVHAMRRAGARREMSARVYLQRDGKVHEGWALNASKGGVRVVLEEKVELGTEYDVVVGDPDNGGTQTRGRIVWVQDEPDGTIAGVEYIGVSGEHPSSPPPGPKDD
jgi:hypothetical protein